jgi:hypothetical protein
MVTTTRPRLRDHLHIGARVFNVHQLRVYRIAALYDEDRTAQITRDHGRYTVTYGDLYRHFRIVQPYAGSVR